MSHTWRILRVGGQATRDGYQSILTVETATKGGVTEVWSGAVGRVCAHTSSGRARYSLEDKGLLYPPVPGESNTYLVFPWRQSHASGAQWRDATRGKPTIQNPGFTFRTATCKMPLWSENRTYPWFLKCYMLFSQRALDYSHPTTTLC